MTTMFVILLLVVGIALPLRADDAEDSAKERGRYLTHHVAMCIQCHSPRNADGVINEDRIFRGGKIPIEGPDWVDRWAIAPPDLVALSKLDPQRILSVLRTGKRPDGTSPNPPMPPFRFSPDDAAAVVRYLQSLP